MELTIKEEKIAKRCAAKYNSFIFRKGKMIGWTGVVLFGLGILPLIPLPEWLKTLFFSIGGLMIIHGVLSDFIIVIGKLYNLSEKVESKPNKSFEATGIITAACFRWFGMGSRSCRAPMSSSVMPQEIANMLTENDIAPELEQYQKFNKAYQSGKRGSDLPSLPKNKDEQQSRLLPIFGLMVHPILAFFVWIARFIHAHCLAGSLSKARIATDMLSYEPKSCGLHKAYTNFGLSFLGRNNLSGAINCLDA
jgi:hypothetical protein